MRTSTKATVIGGVMRAVDDSRQGPAETVTGTELLDRVGGPPARVGDAAKRGAIIDMGPLIMLVVVQIALWVFDPPFRGLALLVMTPAAGALCVRALVGYGRVRRFGAFTHQMLRLNVDAESSSARELDRLFDTPPHRPWGSSTDARRWQQQVCEAVGDATLVQEADERSFPNGWVLDPAVWPLIAPEGPIGPWLCRQIVEHADDRTVIKMLDNPAAELPVDAVEKVAATRRADVLRVLLERDGLPDEVRVVAALRAGPNKPRP